jgi:hypothetical protein
MPHYTFHLIGGLSAGARYPVELADLNEARLYGARLAGRLLSEDPARLWRDGQLQIEAQDETGLSLFALTLVLTSAASTMNVRMPGAEAPTGRAASQR